jgi:hypothetical protein
MYVALVREADRPHDLEQYFSLLASFCSHDGIAIEGLQNAIFKHIQDLVPKTVAILQKSKIESVCIEHKISDPSAHYKDWKVENRPLEGYNYPAFYAAILNTLCQVSFGRHHASRDFLIRHVAPFEVALFILKNEKIDDTIRAAYAVLVQRLYVDAGTLTSKELVLSRSWDDVKDNKASQKRQENIEGLSDSVPGQKKWNHKLVEFLHTFFSGGDTRLSLMADSKYHALLHSKGVVKTSNAVMEAEEAMHAECSHNELTKEVLHLAHAMVTFGFYSDHDRGPANRRDLQHNLLELLLNGSTSGDAAHTDSHSHRVVTSTKVASLEVLLDLFHVYSNDIVSDLLAAFKKEMGHMHGHNHLGAHADSSLKSLSLFSSKSNKFLWFRELVSVLNFDYVVYSMDCSSFWSPCLQTNRIVCPSHGGVCRDPTVLMKRPSFTCFWSSANTTMNS